MGTGASASRSAADQNRINSVTEISEKNSTKCKGRNAVSPATETKKSVSRRLPRIDLTTNTDNFQSLTGSEIDARISHTLDPLPEGYATSSVVPSAPEEGDVAAEYKDTTLLTHLPDNPQVWWRMWGNDPRMSMSFMGASKGLLNAPGANNCFLNSAVQVLWHLDVFRRNFRQLSGHHCMGNSCIFCALKVIFTQFQYSDQAALPPDALRKALAKTFKDQQRFQMGLMDDAAECLEHILTRIHLHLTNTQEDDTCTHAHCLPHRKFSQAIVEKVVCKCGGTSEPHPFSQMVQYVSTKALCDEARQMRVCLDREIPDSEYGRLLKLAISFDNERPCPKRSCGQRVALHRELTGAPEVLAIGLVWDSDAPGQRQVAEVLGAIRTRLRLADLFDSVSRAAAPVARDSEFELVGVVCYYGRHYSTFLRHSKLFAWYSFDDANVKELGDWATVADKCQRGLYQPLLLLYASSNPGLVDTHTAPDRTVMLPGYSFANDPRHDQAASSASSATTTAAHTRTNSAGSDRTLRIGGQAQSPHPTATTTSASGHDLLLFESLPPSSEQERGVKLAETATSGSEAAADMYRSWSGDLLASGPVYSAAPAPRAVTPGPEWGRYDSDEERGGGGDMPGHQHHRQFSYLTAMDEIAQRSGAPVSSHANTGNTVYSQANGYPQPAASYGYDNVDGGSHGYYAQSGLNNVQDNSGYKHGQNNIPGYNQGYQQDPRYSQNTGYPQNGYNHNGNTANYGQHQTNTSSYGQSAYPMNSQYPHQSASNTQNYGVTNLRTQSARTSTAPSHPAPGRYEHTTRQTNTIQQTTMGQNIGQYNVKQQNQMAAKSLGNTDSRSSQPWNEWNSEEDSYGTYISSKTVEKVLGNQIKTSRAPAQARPNYAQVEISTARPNPSVDIHAYNGTKPALHVDVDAESHKDSGYRSGGSGGDRNSSSSNSVNIDSPCDAMKAPHFHQHASHGLKYPQNTSHMPPNSMMGGAPQQHAQQASHQYNLVPQSSSYPHHTTSQPSRNHHPAYPGASHTNGSVAPQAAPSRNHSGAYVPFTPGAARPHHAPHAPQTSLATAARHYERNAYSSSESLAAGHAGAGGAGGSNRGLGGGVAAHHGYGLSSATRHISKSEESLAVIEDNTRPVKDLVKQLTSQLSVGPVGYTNQNAPNKPKQKPPTPQRTTSTLSSASQSSGTSGVSSGVPAQSGGGASSGGAATGKVAQDSLYSQAEELLETSKRKEEKNDLCTALAHCNQAIGCLQQLLSQASTPPDMLVRVRVTHNSAVLRSRALHHKITAGPARQFSASSTASDERFSLSSLSTDEADGHQPKSRNTASSAGSTPEVTGLGGAKTLDFPHSGAAGVLAAGSARTTRREPGGGSGGLSDMPQLPQRRTFMSDYISREDYFSHHPPPPNYQAGNAGKPVSSEFPAPPPDFLKPNPPPKPPAKSKPKLKHSMSSEKGSAGLKAYPDVDEAGGINIYATLPRRPKNRERSSTTGGQPESYQAYQKAQQQQQQPRVEQNNGAYNITHAESSGYPNHEHHSANQAHNSHSQQKTANHPGAPQGNRPGRRDSAGDMLDGPDRYVFVTSQHGHQPQPAGQDLHNLSIESMVTQQINQLSLPRGAGYPAQPQHGNQSSHSSSPARPHHQGYPQQHDANPGYPQHHGAQPGYPPQPGAPPGGGVAMGGGEGPRIQRVMPQQCLPVGEGAPPALTASSQPLPVYPQPPHYQGNGRQVSVDSHPSSSGEEGSGYNNTPAALSRLEAHMLAIQDQLEQPGADTFVSHLALKHELRQSASSSNIPSDPHTNKSSGSKSPKVSKSAKLPKKSTSVCHDHTSVIEQRSTNHKQVGANFELDLKEDDQPSSSAGYPSMVDIEQLSLPFIPAGSLQKSSPSSQFDFLNFHSNYFSHGSDGGQGSSNAETPSLGGGLSKLGKHRDSLDTLVAPSSKSNVTSCYIDGCEYITETSSYDMKDADLAGFCVLEKTGNSSELNVPGSKVDPSDCSGSSSGIDVNTPSDASSYSSAGGGSGRSRAAKPVLVKKKIPREFKARKNVTFSDKVILVAKAPEDSAEVEQGPTDYVAYVQALLSRSPRTRAAQQQQPEIGSEIAARSATPTALVAAAQDSKPSGYDSDFDEETDDSCTSEELEMVDTGNSSGEDKVQCSLCRKRRVQLTHTFCEDCSFYMAQFQAPSESTAGSSSVAAT